MNETISTSSLFWRTALLVSGVLLCMLVLSISTGCRGSYHSPGVRMMEYTGESIDGVRRVNE